MADAEKREAVRQFIQKWQGKGKEDEDDRSYWIDILERIMGVQNVTDYFEFQKKVIVDGNTKRIDVYIPETRVLIEQKSLGIDLDKPIQQSGGIALTPYEQAKRYNDNLPFDEKARWIVTSNFSEIWIYDMNDRVPTPQKIEIKNLREQYSRLDFLVSKQIVKISSEMKISLKAGEIVGEIYDAFLKQYKDSESELSLKSLNKLCVRLVFCFYAEDAGIFGVKNLFHDYLIQYNAKTARKALVELFKVLNQKPEERNRYLSDDDPILAQFPYVNGGLFADEDIDIPPFTDEIFNLIVENASNDFDWSKMSPTIFGAVFESTLNPETRRKGGMHYTSIENIHKVIDPLFLDELKEELANIKIIDITKTKEKKLKEFQNKIAELKFLDPACGSGNFLTETYISIRRLENEMLEALYGKNNELQLRLDIDGINPIKVGINQFYGIEINDFAVSVAQTALWIAESQMMKETEDIVHTNFDFLPLKTNAFIVEGNALRMDWEDVISKTELNYIMGNPPFVGASFCNNIQKQEVVNLFEKVKLSNSLDYVAGWYYKAGQMINDTKIHCAFVSTNSITQGEQVAPLWNTLFKNFGIKIDFAYKTFRWDSEASIKAHIHCVIIGFSIEKENTNKKIYFDDGTMVKAQNINPYLIDAPSVIIQSVSKPLCQVPKMTKGNQPTDDGNFILSEVEYQNMIAQDPTIKQCIKRYVGGRDYLNNNEIRYCIWLKDISPEVYCHNKEIIQRLDNIKKFREKSTAEPTRKFAEKPHLFFSTPQTNDNYLIIPRVSSEKRRYIPIGFMMPDVIASDSCSIVMGATLYHFGILTSNVHMAWMRTVAGRLEMRYRYSGAVVYNNFPWPMPQDEQKAKIEQTAKGILDARALYPNSTLAEMYSNMWLYPELTKAHNENDRAVMQAYGFNIREMSEADCVAELMKMYQEFVEK